MKSKKIISLLLTQTIAAGAAAFPVQAASTTPQSFFSELNYEAFTELSAVKAAADSGDYQTAKKELLEYYKNRRRSGKQLGFDITEADANYNMAVLPMRNILTGPYEFDMWQGEFTVKSSEYTEYETDVTDRISAELNNGAVSFMLFAGDKQQYPVYVKSKESGSAPKLIVTYDNGGGEKTAEIAASQDTYISSKNTSAIYGTVDTMSVKEDGTGTSSTGTETTRAYVTFPLHEAQNSDIKSAKLVVNAAYDASCNTGDKDVLVINVGDTTWSETSLTWKGTRGSIYSYQNADVPKWNADAPNADSEYHNVTARFWFGRPMAYEYLSYLKDPEKYDSTHPYAEVYPGAEFGPKLISLMSAFAQQMNHGWPRTLETGERLNRWVDIVDALLMTDAFDGREDDFYNIITFMYGDCKYLNGLDIASGKPWWSNWRIVANAGFFKAAEYLPELNMHDTFRAKAEYNVEYTMNLLYNDDMSFSEAGPSYAQWCAELFGDCVKAAEKAGAPMSNDFKKKLTYASLFAVHSYLPDGYDSNTGDSNYRDKMPKFKALNELVGNEELNNYVNGTGDVSFTRVYPEANAAFMRTGWNPDETTYISFVNSPADGHAHPDSNQILMYAYGQPLLVDSGRYSYSDTNDIYKQLRTANAHNTIEAVGVSMSDHSKSAEEMKVLADNDAFTLVSSNQHGYSGTNHTRSVLFLKKKDMPVLVSDYIKAASSRTYRQNWHFMPSNNAAVSGNTITTDFYGKANVAVANADADASAQLRDGYFSADYGLVAKSEYASFEKTGSEVKFTTVLQPIKAGEKRQVVASDTSSSAGSAAVNAENIDFYIDNAGGDGKFGSNTTDAKAAYINRNNTFGYAIVNGTKLASSETDYIVSAENIKSIAVETDGADVRISGEGLKADKSAQAIRIYAPGAENVYLNGSTVGFTKDGDYIYAAAVTSETEQLELSVTYKDTDGNNIAEMSVSDGVRRGYLYVYDAPSVYETNGNVYILDKAASDLTVLAGDEGTLTAVYRKTNMGENLITNGDFTNGTADWTNAADGGQYTGRLSDDYSNAGKSITNTASAGGSAVSTLRRFVPVEGGKTYHFSCYAYNTGAEITGTAFMSAFVPVKGTSFGNFNGVTFKDYIACGGQNSWSAEAQSEVKRDRADMKYGRGMNHIEYTMTVPEDADHILISMFAWTDPGRLYFSDFSLREIKEEEPQPTATPEPTTEPTSEPTPEPTTEPKPELIFDGTTARVENYDGDYTIIVSQYDGDGRLLEVKTAQNEAVTIERKENAAEVRAFVWDGIGTMRPVI